MSNNRLKDFLVADELNDYVEKFPPAGGPTPNAIEVREATLGWERADPIPVLHNLSFTVPKNKLILVVGTVGSGKSSLLMALLGSFYYLFS